MTTEMTLQDWCYDFISRLKYNEITDLQTFIALIKVCILVRQKIQQNQFINQLDQNLKTIHAQLIPSIRDEKLLQQQKYIKQYQDEIKNLKNELSEQESTIEIQKKEISDNHVKIKDLTVKNSEFTGGFERFVDKFQAEFDQNQKLTERIDELESQLSFAQKQIKFYKNAIERLSGEAKNISQEQLVKLNISGLLKENDQGQKIQSLLKNTGFIYDMLQTSYLQIDELEQNTKQKA